MEITNADLNALATRLETAFRHEVGLLRAESGKDIRGVYHRIDELKGKQETQNGRVNENSAAIAALRAEQHGILGRLEKCEEIDRDHSDGIGRIDERTKRVSPHLGVTLTPKQKAAAISMFITGMGGLIEAARHLVPTMLAYFFGGGPR